MLKKSWEDDCVEFILRRMMKEDPDLLIKLCFELKDYKL
jgi:hypothetical protein